MYITRHVNVGIIEYKAQVLIDKRFLLAEGPVYIEKSDSLLFVDIDADAFFLHDLKTGALEKFEVGQRLGAAVPAKSGRYVLAMTTGVYLYGEEHLQLICRPDGLTADLRLNDAKCDPAGRFLFGTIPLFYETSEPGSLYSLEADGSSKKLDITPRISNGMAWSADGKTMYYNDSDTKGTDAFDYDMETGAISRRRRVFSTERVPDGMAIDSEGMLWVALWGGYKVVRVNPADGNIIGEVPVPAENVTSCCFGGVDYKTLFITTSSHGDDSTGCIYAANVGIEGTKPVFFDDNFWL